MEVELFSTVIANGLLFQLILTFLSDSDLTLLLSEIIACDQSSSFYPFAVLILDAFLATKTKLTATKWMMTTGVNFSSKKSTQIESLAHTRVIMGSDKNSVLTQAYWMVNMQKKRTTSCLFYTSTKLMAAVFDKIPLMDALRTLISVIPPPLIISNVGLINITTRRFVGNLSSQKDLVKKQRKNLLFKLLAEHRLELETKITAIYQKNWFHQLHETLWGNIFLIFWINLSLMIPDLLRGEKIFCQEDFQFIYSVSNGCRFTASKKNTRIAPDLIARVLFRTMASVSRISSKKLNNSFDKLVTFLIDCTPHTYNASFGLNQRDREMLSRETIYFLGIFHVHDLCIHLVDESRIQMETPSHPSSLSLDLLMLPGFLLELNPHLTTGRQLVRVHKD